jgi:signal transduction histidine kinase
MSGSQEIGASGRTILIVDDRVETRRILARRGHRVLAAKDVPSALAILGDETVHVMILGHLRAAANVDELMARVRERDRLVQVVVEPAGDDALLLAVDLALKTYDQVGRLHIAERLKTELLASVSHELRTPLNVILGYVDLLREGTFGPCPADALPVVDKVRHNASYLLELVEEFLDLAKLEAGGTPLRLESVALGPLLRELGEWFALLVRTRPIEFVTDLADDLPTVAADRAKVRVVIQNLLSNAAKFTRAGTIRLSAVRRDDARVAICVSDTGPGIAAEDREAIFDVFHQLRPHDLETKGAGLGLALARRFARMMGGDVLVESAVGAGSTFTLLLPHETRGAIGDHTTA